MSIRNAFDDYNSLNLKPEEQAEVDRYIALWKDIQREDAASKVQDLARQLMALSTLLADDDGNAAIPAHQSTSSTSKVVQSNAEFIHRRIAEARHAG